MIMQSICGVMAACSLGGESPSEVVHPTTVIQPSPRVIEVQPRVIVKPRETIVIRRAPIYVYARRHRHYGCSAYQCWGQSSSFRLPNEVPYAEYERQYGPPTNGDGGYYEDQ